MPFVFLAEHNFSTRERISRAALLVKVTAVMCLASTPLLIKCEIFSVITRVFPLPAPAITNRGVSVVETAFCCSGLSSCTAESLAEKGNEFYSIWGLCNAFIHTSITERFGKVLALDVGLSIHVGDGS